MMTERTHCELCECWERVTEMSGICRRRAPAMNDDMGDAAWPVTAADDWCFEAITMLEAPDDVV